MFKKVLVPLDGSEIAAKVLPMVVELAKSCPAKVTLFHVCYSRGGGLRRRGFSGGDRGPKRPRNKNSAPPSWPRPRRTYQDQGVQADSACEDGVPAREIIAFAQDKGYDLIVMGTHGAGEVAWYMGGVADKVASHATVPVLLLRTLDIKPPLLKEIFFCGARG